MKTLKPHSPNRATFSKSMGAIRKGLIPNRGIPAHIVCSGRSHFISTLGSDVSGIKDDAFAATKDYR
jgi:hypothetical protein